MMDDRTMVVAMALQGLLAHGPTGEPADVYAEDAVTFADALLKRLAETAPEADESEAHETEMAYAAADRLIGAEERNAVPGTQLEADGIKLSEAVCIAALKGFHKIYSADGIVRNRDVLGACRAAIAVDRAERPLVLPPGWVAVPRELTVDMWDADEASDRNNLEEVWGAILAAAPSCPGVKETNQ